MKACLLIGESSKSNLGRIPADCGGEVSAKEMEDIIRNMGVVNIEKGEIDATEKRNMEGKEMSTMGVQEKEGMGEKEREEMGAIYLLSNLDSPSALAWALLQPLSPLLRWGQAISQHFTFHTFRLLQAL